MLTVNLNSVIIVGIESSEVENSVWHQGLSQSGIYAGIIWGLESLVFTLV